MRSQAEVARAKGLFAAGYTKAEIARATGIPYRTISDWLSGKTPNFNGDRGGYECPVCADRLDLFPTEAYVYLLGLYLGDGTISAAARDVYKLRIVCCDAYPELMQMCDDAMAAVFPTKVGRVAKIGCTEVYSYSKHWPCLFPQHGPGVKHLRKIELADWQQKLVDVDPRPLIKGLIHSDGCRVLNRAAGTDYPPYPRYHFTNASDDIKKIFTDACDAIGVEWRHNNARNVSIAKRASVAILDEFVGPKR